LYTGKIYSDIAGRSANNRTVTMHVLAPQMEQRQHNGNAIRALGFKNSHNEVVDWEK